ncbi:MAG TPA: Fe-S cluster assembly protein SufD [Stellaceae bacterium]|jgi:Fe-S cluster assembly protein SufD
MAVKTEAAPYLEAFRPDASEPAWLADARRKALAAFGERGFPTRREEAWRFTSLRPLADKSFKPGRGKLELKSAALPNGVWFASMARTLAERPEIARRAINESDLAGGQPFASLNAALFGDGFVFALDEGVTLDDPMEIVHSAAEGSINLRNLIVLAPNSRATVVETYRGKGAYWTNTVTSVSVGASASLTHVKVQDEGSEAIHFGMVRATLAPLAAYRNFGLTLGANLSRQDVQVAHGDGSNADVSGAYLQRGDQDTTTAVVIDHAAPNATTHELFKGVLDDRAHGAFLGTIRVREGAQKTDAKQTSRALLLGDRASVDTKPELEILADDVKCAHGAAVGDLDPAMLFYLRARGIGENEARRMLIEAFVLDAIEAVEQPELRNHLASLVHDWLEAGR